MSNSNVLKAPYVYTQSGQVLNDAALNVPCDECGACERIYCRLKNPQEEGFPVVHHTSRHKKAIEWGHINTIEPDYAEFGGNLVKRIVRKILGGRK